MSLKALMKELNQKLDWPRVIGLGLLLILLGIVLFFAWFRNPRHLSATRKQQEKQKILKSLLEIRNTAEKVEQNLKRRSASLTSDVPENQRRATTPSTSTGIGEGRAPAYVELKPSGGWSKVETKKQEIYIPSGAVFQAQLMMPIKTSIQANFVKARTTAEFIIDSVRRIPRNSELIGSAQLDPMLRGVVVRFKTLVSPNHLEYPVDILALSADLFPELDGIYFSNQIETYSTIMAFGFLSGFADAARQTQPTIIGPVPEQTLRNDLFSGISTASFRVADEMLQDIRRRAVEYVVVPAGERIFVVFLKRFVLPDGKPIED